MREKQPYLSYLVQDKVREFARTAVSAWLEQHKRLITEMISERISETSVIDALAKAFAGSTNEEWKISISFDKEER